MDSKPPQGETRELAEIWSVLVLYDSQPTRQRALQVCDHLVERFWHEVEFRFGWWRTDFLNEPGMAAAAAEQSVEADFIIVCLSPESAMSPLLGRWFDDWIPKRENREGAFIDIPFPDPAAGAEGRRRNFLREAAHRAGMDYLTCLPATMTRTLPDSSEAANDRARQMTSVLDNILHHSPPPPKLKQT